MMSYSTILIPCSVFLIPLLHNSFLCSAPLHAQLIPILIAQYNPRLAKI
jgi:hypothetical protein